MLHIMLKSGCVFSFDPSEWPFEFNEKGYFCANGLLSYRGHSDGFREVFDFVFHKDEMSCNWMEM